MPIRIDPDDFEEWQAHPITEALFRALVTWAGEAKDSWVAKSWDGENADPMTLAKLRERARTLVELREISRESIEEAS